MAFFLLKSYLYRILKFKFEISALKPTDVQNFIQIGQKIKDLELQPRTTARTAWWRQTHIIVMASSKFLMLLRDFVPEYNYAKFGGDWTTNKGET